MLRGLFAFVAWVLLAGVSQAQTTDAAATFADPVSALSATISPDGNYIAYIARDNQYQTVVVVDLAAGQAHAVQRITNRVGRLIWVKWKGSDHLVIEAVAVNITVGNYEDAGNVERVFAINRDGTGFVQMFQGRLHELSWGYGSTTLINDLPSDPTHVLIGAYGIGGFDAWIADVTNGSVREVADGSENTENFAADINGNVVMRVDDLPDLSGYRIYRRAPGATDWTFVLQARKVETATNSPDFQALTAGPEPGQIYVLARPDNTDLLSLYLYNAASGDLGQPLAAGVNGDAAEPWLGRRGELLATCESWQRTTCHANDPVLQQNLNAVDAFFHHQAAIELVNMSDDGAKWVLHVDGPMMPSAYYLYEVATHRVTPIADCYPNVDVNQLSPPDVVTYQSRDGAALWAYVTARPGANGPRPMVVFPHGGPEARDDYGYNAYVEFLASRGYVVLQPNFRGGGGFGRAFADAGRGQWGLRMQDDITDAVHHMIDAGVADPNRICIVGASYGGYAALEGVAATPDLYKCAVSISGVSDLHEMVRVSGTYSHANMGYQYWIRSIGDPDRDASAIAAASPRLHADRITAPVLLIHGDSDITVDFHQSELMQAALNSAGHPTRLIRLVDEDHYWNNWKTEDRLLMFRESEAFIEQHIGAGTH